MTETERAATDLLRRVEALVRGADAIAAKTQRIATLTEQIAARDDERRARERFQLRLRAAMLVTVSMGCGYAIGHGRWFGVATTALAIVVIFATLVPYSLDPRAGKGG